jgi:hypothetical protein
MTDKQKQSVKQAARDLCQAGRISLAMAIWAMKNAGYTREETAAWLGLEGEHIEIGNTKEAV